MKPRRFRLKSAALIVALSLPMRGRRRRTRAALRATVHWTPSRTYHVENYKLRLRFSQSRGEVFGHELVTIRPFESGFDSFCINSTELTIDSVTMVAAANAPKALAHTTDDHCLWIRLDHPYGPSDSLEVRIVYHVYPKAGTLLRESGERRSWRAAPGYPHTGRARIQPPLVSLLGLSK